MLNIFKLKTKEKEEKEILNLKLKQPRLDNYIWSSKHYPSASREWTNNIYSYFYFNSILLPKLDKISLNFIKGFFNMYNYKLEKLIKLPFIKRWKRRLLIYRFWISNGGIKHTNEKIIITIYIYNERYNYLLKKLYRLKLFYMSNINKFKYRQNVIYLLHNTIISDKINKILKNRNYKNFNLEFYINEISYKLISKCMNKQILYLKYKQIILFNKLKFTNNLLLPLKSLLTKIYRKNIEFNIITLKNSYLNSNIMSQIILTKIRDRRNKPVKVLATCIRKINTPVINDNNIIREPNKVIGVYNDRITKFLINNSNNNKEEYINEFLDHKYKLNNYTKEKENKNIILNNIKHKILCGAWLRASGRLTKRITAARSIYKFKQTGSLKNIDSSYKGLSTVMLRGNKKSNIQFTFLNSKTRIGSFGLKGWVSGY